MPFPKILPDVKLILISGYPKDELINSGKILNEVPLLAKLFNQNFLRDMIRKVLSSHISG